MTVTDVKTGKSVFKGKFTVEANGRTKVASLPEPAGQGIYKITYTGRDGVRAENHYLYGKAPFSLKEYRTLLRKTGMFNVK